MRKMLHMIPPPPLLRTSGNRLTDSMRCLLFQKNIAHKYKYQLWKIIELMDAYWTKRADLILCYSLIKKQNRAIIINICESLGVIINEQEIGIIQNNDLIEINISNRSINLLVDSKEIEKRIKVQNIE